MSDAWQSIKIRQFEHVPSAAATSLLRVSGRSPWRRATSARPILRVDRSGEARRFAAVPAPDDPRGSLRAAYSVPTALVAADSTYWLEHPDGSLTELPTPETGPGRLAADPTPAAPAADASEAPSAAHGNGDPDELPGTERRSDLLAKLAEQSQELARAEREAAEHEKARRAAEIELARAREAQRQAGERATRSEADNEQLRATIGELEVWRGELERRLAAFSSELGAAKAARQADQRELRRLREAVTEAESRTHEPGQGTETSRTLAAQAIEIELLVAEVASLRAERNRSQSST